MTSSIFLPRRSRAWPEPSTHLTESTMFVFPEPLGPTMAVTPPSNWISVCRAKVLKPSNCRDLKNKLAGRVPDVGPGSVPRHQPAQCAGIVGNWVFRPELGTLCQRTGTPPEAGLDSAQCALNSLGW